METFLRRIDCFRRTYKLLQQDSKGYGQICYLRTNWHSACVLLQIMQLSTVCNTCVFLRISKLFELCLLEIYGEYLESSDLQFGFKKRIGCNHALFVVKSVVEYFIAGGSVINLCALDMSKAFDKVNHYGLFIKLMSRCVPFCFY